MGAPAVRRRGGGRDAAHHARRQSGDERGHLVQQRARPPAGADGDGRGDGGDRRPAARRVGAPRGGDRRGHLRADHERARSDGRERGEVRFAA
ncbi:MAG: hypothetical protein FJ318_07685 [SAR202 cluster bacterium]|nr:hypothetical protein [SAR202 cluster bacterium]